MYQINIGNKILYYPGSDDAVVYDTELNEEVGAAGEFQFKVPASNPAYAELSMGSLITILKNGKEEWRGEIRDISIDFNKVANIYVLEDYAWLADEYLPPAHITNQTYTQRFTAAINSYNSGRPAERQFLVGYISNVVSSNLCNWKTEYEWSILESIRKCIGKDDGYVRVRRQYENGTIKRYIDVVPLSGYGVAASQPIEYGYNLLDYVKESDYGNLTNVLTPYGDTLDDDTEVYEGYSARLQGTTITNSASVSAYGRHAKAVVFDGVTSLTSLNNLASAYLSRYCQPQLTMEVSAVDLSEIEDADAIKLGDSVRIIAKPFAVDQRLYLTKITRDLQCLDKNKITLSGHVARRTLTSQVIETMNAVEEIPDESDILKAAKRNALNMLLDETQGGYVVFEYYDNNSKMQAISICDDATIAASLKRWRWALNGLGYMERANTGASWPDDANVPVAITMKGEIVADFLTVGMIKLCGAAKNASSSKLNPARDAFLKVFNGNTEIGRWGSDGIWIRKGAIDLGALINNEGTFHVDDNGYMKLRSGFIQIGTKSGNRYPFYVDDQGHLQATNGDFTGSITVGGNNNANGYISVQDSSGAEKVKLDKDGIDVKKGSIKGANVTVGGNNNGNGVISVQDASGTEKVKLDKEGIIAESECIAVVSGGYIKHHQRNTGTSSQWVFDLGCRYCNCQYDDDGWHWVNGGATEIYKYLEGAYNPSDQRSKTKIEELDPEFSHNLIMNTKPKMFEFKYKRGVKMFGMIAQDVDEDFKDLGFTEKNGLLNIPDDPEEWMSIEYKQYIPHLINVVQMQQAQINKLQKEINILKGADNG